MFCESCGAELEAIAKFCPKCGVAVDERPSVEDNSNVTEEINTVVVAENMTDDIVEPVQEVAQEPVQEVVQEPVQEVSQEPVQEVVQEQVQEVMQESVQGVSQEPVQEVVQEPVQEVVQEPVQEVAQEPVQEQPVVSVPPIVNNTFEHGTVKPVGVFGYVLMMLLMMIPGVNVITFIVLVFSKNPNKRHFAIASLILLLLFLAVLIAGFFMLEELIYEINDSIYYYLH